MLGTLLVKTSAKMPKSILTDVLFLIQTQASVIYTKILMRLTFISSLTVMIVYMV